MALTGGAALHDSVTAADDATQAARTAAVASADADERAQDLAAASRSTRDSPAGTPGNGPAESAAATPGNAPGGVPADGSGSRIGGTSVSTPGNSPAPSAPPANPTPNKPGAVPDGPEPAPAPSRTTRRPAAAPAWVDPMPEGRTTSCFGRRWGRLHAGIDLAAGSGTRVRAAGAGTVVSAGADYAGYGLSVLIDHGNGVYTHYAHLSRVSVAPGDRVTPGRVLGAEGSTGNSTGPHLHFEVHEGRWNRVDPAAWMAERGVDLGC